MIEEGSGDLLAVLPLMAPHVAAERVEAEVADIITVTLAASIGASIGASVIAYVAASIGASTAAAGGAAAAGSRQATGRAVRAAPAAWQRAPRCAPPNRSAGLRLPRRSGPRSLGGKNGHDSHMGPGRRTPARQGTLLCYRRPPGAAASSSCPVRLFLPAKELFIPHVSIPSSASSAACESQKRKS